MLPLLGIAVLAIGFAARLNPLAVIVAAAVTSGLIAGMAPLTVIAHLGKAFNGSRFVTLAFVALPVIGLLERHGLQARALPILARGPVGEDLHNLSLLELPFRVLIQATDTDVADALPFQMNCLLIIKLSGQV